MTPDILQFGAMGLLAIVLVGGGRAVMAIGKSLSTAIDGLRDEVASSVREQKDTNRLMSLMIYREFGAEKAGKILEEEPHVGRQER